VLGAPLALFRVSASFNNAPGVWDNVLFAVAQILGIALIGTSALALRRNIGSTN
jgi:hypothetical protein